MIQAKDTDSTKKVGNIKVSDMTSMNFNDDLDVDFFENSNKGKTDGKNLFNNFCNKLVSYLSIDERAELSQIFLNEKIKSVFKDSELIECVNMFFKNNLNLSETSRIAFVHRNTLIYRIDKIYKITGLNIRNFEDAMSFKILSIVYDNMQSDSKKRR